MRQRAAIAADGRSHAAEDERVSHRLGTSGRTSPANASTCCGERSTGQNTIVSNPASPRPAIVSAHHCGGPASGSPARYDERRFLTRQQLARLLAEIPAHWRPLFDLLASTGLRISEAIGLRVMDARLETDAPCVHVRRAIVNGQLTAPKSRHGRRTIPISLALANRLRELAAGRVETELLFRGAQGAVLRPGNLRYRVLIPAAQRAGVPWARFYTLRHTCAAMLIDAGASPLRLQRWMGHHSAAFTLDTYGHLLGDDLGPHLDLGLEIC